MIQEVFVPEYQIQDMTKMFDTQDLPPETFWIFVTN